MNDYIQPTLKEKSDHFIIHTKTNYVTSDGKLLVDWITKLEISLKEGSNYVAISNIITRKNRWNDKVDEINKHLAEQHKKQNCLQENSTSIKPQHLNKNRLHLNKKGNTILQEAFVKHIADNFTWISEILKRRKIYPRSIILTQVIFLKI